MPMLRDPSQKYAPFAAPSLPDRTWPSKTITKSPRWLATDLRDGNQSLAHPMTVAEKQIYFDLLIRMGFKEIDVAFPSASETEFNFTRQLVETPNAVPEDVWLQVLSPCRRELIKRTVESVTGAKKAIISLYIASSDAFQSTIFGLSRQDVFDMAVDCVRYTKSITKDDPAQHGTSWNLMFSPEAFSDTDSSYAIALCDAVREAWDPTPEIPLILNLPATVEMSTPNTFADQVELFCRAFPHDSVTVSLHPHNDRGCAVAAAELGQLAGATRVEGCLFGNGERTGNVDLVTLALNLYTQGVDPELDFSDLPGIRKTVEKLTQIPVHMRAPYAGDSVFLAYSGSHQDAINKGFKMWENPPTEGKKNIWTVPYLPLDPKDIGATYESVIRVNSQSGKGGVAWTLQRSVDLDLPKALQQDFSKIVKSASDKVGRVLSPVDIQDLFLDTYHVRQRDARILKHGYHARGRSSQVEISATILINGLARDIRGSADGIAAAVSSALAIGTGLQLPFEVFERKWVENGKTQEMAVANCHLKGGHYVSWGASMCSTFEEAELLACLSSALGLQKYVPSLRLLPIAPEAQIMQEVRDRRELVRVR
ncbi:aldolase [Mytilinidion resinicola]|uniref:2-isopropylmalate synthase n=1 Tax=Mytilinidion resinicola TaxID=574789 RepID=A0A6A6Y3E9_9PEZI|nr:aldolase [Mytilinidion resinicola]KAF2802755.1 aldolase [Mytilinidion resinicola]